MSQENVGNFSTPPPQGNDTLLYGRKMHGSLFALSPTTGLPAGIPMSPMYRRYSLGSPVDYFKSQGQQNQDQKDERHYPLEEGDKDGEEQNKNVEKRRKVPTLQPPRKRLQKAIQLQGGDVSQDPATMQFGMDQEILTGPNPSVVSDQQTSRDGVMDASMSPTKRRPSFASGMTPTTPSTLFGYQHMKFHESPALSPMSNGRFYFFSPSSPLPPSMSPMTPMSSSSNRSPMPMSPNSNFPQRNGTPYMMYPYPQYPHFGYYPYAPYRPPAPNGFANETPVKEATPQDPQQIPPEMATTAPTTYRVDDSTRLGENLVPDVLQVAELKSKKRKSRIRDSGRPSHAGECGNCGSSDTPMWRRSKFNKDVILCNKCGLYEARTGRNRPMLKRKPIKRRKQQQIDVDGDALIPSAQPNLSPFLPSSSTTAPMTTISTTVQDDSASQNQMKGIIPHAVPPQEPSLVMQQDQIYPPSSS